MITTCIIYTEFQEKIILILVDKGIIGLLIILFGYILNRAIENFKSKKNIEVEISKKKIDKLSEAYDSLSDFENCVNDILLYRLIIVHSESLCLNKILETDLQFKKEFEKHLDDEFDIRDFPENYRILFDKCTREQKDKVDRLEKEVDEKANLFFDLLEKNHFWMSSKQYEKLEKFSKIISDKLPQKFDKLIDIENYLLYETKLKKDRLTIDMFFEK